MTQIIDLVDSIDYTLNNCFGHQLHQSLHKNQPGVVTVALNEIHNYPNPRHIISRLKQRTLYRCAEQLREWCGDTPMVIFDQDPWQAYMDDSPYKGAYEHIASTLNVKTFALTTKWWVDFLHERNLPATFVRMWVLPRYCSFQQPYIDRRVVAGFIGTVHPRRQRLLDVINAAGIETGVLRTNTLSYGSFLAELGKLRCFVHNEDMPIYVDGREHNFNTGMWVKDIEAASQGCFSIRNSGEGSDTYFKDLPEIDGNKLVMLYDRIEDVPSMIAKIENMDQNVRQELIDVTVKHIRDTNVWQETAHRLIEC